MNKNIRLIGLALAVVVALLIPLKADAVCGTATSFGSYYSFVTNSGFTGTLRGSFWTLGVGNPTLAAGNDNGSFSDTGTGHWLVPYGSGMAILGHWAMDSGIDGCCDAGGSASSQRMVFALSDVDGTGAMRYAVACAHRDTTAGLQFDITRPGNAAIALVVAPKANITNTVRSGNEATITVGSPDFSAGLYSDGSTGCEAASVIPSYDVYKQQIGRGAAPDTNRDLGPWVLVGTGTTGSSFSFPTTCATTDCDVYVAVAPHYNSNFSTGEPATGAPNRVGLNSNKVQAGPILAVTPKPRVITNKKTAE